MEGNIQFGYISSCLEVKLAQLQLWTKEDYPILILHKNVHSNAILKHEEVGSIHTLYFVT